MPYPFPEFEFQDDLEGVYQCSTCCSPPNCGLPSLIVDQRAAQSCFFVVYDAETECFKYYKTQRRVKNDTVSNQEVINGVTVETEEIVTNRSVESTYETPSNPCELTLTCTIADTYTYRSYFYQLDENGNVNAGPFPSVFIDEEFEPGEGLPDPTWIPGEGQTEEDRPLLGPCTYILTSRLRIYTADFDEQNILTGSTLDLDQTTVLTGSIQIDGEPEYLNEIDCEALRASLVAPDWEEENPPPLIGVNDPISQFNCTLCEVPELYIAIWLRYKWQVPPCFPGSYYKIEWDEIYYPIAFDEWLDDAIASEGGIQAFDPNLNPPPELPTLTHKVWEWTGAALGDCSGDPDEFDERNEIEARKSDWYYIDPPMETGRITVGNVTALCYRSKFGNLPFKIDSFDIFDFDDVDKDTINDTLEPLPPP